MPNLRPAEQRVAAAVLADPARAAESSITVLARECRTSETTVLRFCRAVGLPGYPDLRLALARAAQFEEGDEVTTVAVNAQITAGDPLGDVVAKVAHAAGRSVNDTASTLDLAALEAAVDTVASAGRIGIYGVGPSALAGADLQQKLHSIGRACFFWSDPHVALTSSAVLTEGDVAIGVSHTGTTVDTIDVLGRARGRGVHTIAITNHERSPIADAADVVLVTAARDTTFLAGGMASRVAQLVLIECLFAAVAQRSFETAVSALEHAGDAVATRHGRRA